MESFYFAGIDEDWIYHMIDNHMDSTCTLWRASKDRTVKSALVTRDIDPYGFTPANGRLYYTFKSYDDIPISHDAIYSSPIDFFRNNHADRI